MMACEYVGSMTCSGWRRWCCSVFNFYREDRRWWTMVCHGRSHSASACSGCWQLHRYNLICNWCAQLRCRMHPLPQVKYKKKKMLQTYLDLQTVKLRMQWQTYRMENTVRRIFTVWHFSCEISENFHQEWKLEAMTCLTRQVTQFRWRGCILNWMSLGSSTH